MRRYRGCQFEFSLDDFEFKDEVGVDDLFTFRSEDVKLCVGWCNLGGG